MESPGLVSSPPSLKTTPAVGQHLGYLDGLRAMAALYVLFHHTLLQVDSNPANHPKRLLLLEGLRFGRYAVDLFIVLSGFCLMLPVIKQGGEIRGGALNFFKRRALRILPPYYGALVLSLLLDWGFIGHITHTHWDASLPISAKSIFWHLFLLHDAAGEEYSINSPFWSIAVEWRIYFLFPLLVLLWRRIGPFATTALSVVMGLVLCVVAKKIFDNTLTSGYIGLFAMGMLAATLRFSPPERFARWRAQHWGAWYLAMTGTLAAMSLFAFRRDYPTSLIIPFDVVVGGWALTLLMWVSGGNNWGHKLLSCSPLVWVGSFAYSLYLLHAPLLQLVWQYPLARLDSAPFMMFWTLLLVGIPLIIGACYLFFLACERPFLRRRVPGRPESFFIQAVLAPAP